MSCPDHHSYLVKLGAERLFALKGKLSIDDWPLYFLEDDGGDAASAATAAEQMIAMAGREIERVTRQQGYDTILAGVGASHLASWLAYYSLREQDRQVALMAEIGLYGYIPLPGDSFVFALRNFPTAQLLSLIHI